MSQRTVYLFGYRVTEHGVGEFGMIYSGITDQEAVDFLLKIQHGEIYKALDHPVLGPIDLVYGKETIGNKIGFGLAKIQQKHPDAVLNLAEQIKNAEIIEELPGRRILVTKNNNQRSIIDLQWFEQKKTWLVNSYIPF